MWNLSKKKIAQIPSELEWLKKYSWMSLVYYGEKIKMSISYSDNKYNIFIVNRANSKITEDKYFNLSEEVNTFILENL